MLKSYASEFVEINHVLEECLGMMAMALAANEQNKKIGQYPQKQGNDFFKWEVIFKNLDESLERAKIVCEELELRSAITHIKRFDSERPYQEERLLSIANLMRELRQRIEDELRGVEFLFVPTSRSEYYNKPIFGIEVEDTFSDAIDDIREAGNCYALGRWTGVVHHCMGVMQVGLTRLAHHLDIEIDLHLDDWNKIITKIEAAIGHIKPSAKNVTSEWKQKEPFYSELISDARAVKDAWRNPTAHFRRQYDETQAKKVLEKVDDFMRNLVKLP